MSALVIEPNRSLALTFVSKIKERHKRLAGSPKGNPAVSIFAENDSIVPLTEKFLGCQDFFRKCNSPDDVTLTYHYTNRKAMSNIQQNGLMTLAEQQKQQPFTTNSSSNGATYGRGIYTATNPFVFSEKYGELGLIVAVIKGKTERVKENTARSATSSVTPCSATGARDALGSTSISTNTVIGNKLSDRQIPLLSHVNDDSNNNEFFDEVVLLDSSQCLPLVQFSSSLVSKTEDNSDGNDTIWAYHKELQKIVDTFFNNDEHTELYRILPSMKTYIPLTTVSIQHIFQQFKSSNKNNHLVLQNSANSSTTSNVNHNTHNCNTSNNNNNCNQTIKNANLKRKFKSVPDKESVIGKRWARQRQLPHFPMIKIMARIKYEAPTILNAEIKSSYFRKPKIDHKATCPICMEHFVPQDDHHNASNVVSLTVCDHHFHRSCIEQCLARNHSCPVCRKNIREPQGTSPSGAMTVTLLSKPCSGFESCQRSIGICYTLPSGIQKYYHENPAQPYTGTKRHAFLPNNEEGQNLLERFKYAWLRGLTFRVGTSLTTGRPNCIVWSSIHHKTSRSGDVLAHGFPDSNYFTSCNQELTSLGVPAASECFSINNNHRRF